MLVRRLGPDRRIFNGFGCPAVGLQSMPDLVEARRRVPRAGGKDNDGFGCHGESDRENVLSVYVEELRVGIALNYYVCVLEPKSILSSFLCPARFVQIADHRGEKQLRLWVVIKTGILPSAEMDDTRMGYKDGIM